ncbi:galectin-3-like isoform X2 [Notolabrus celidotus]|uniref:galectin-3-like isoform X2 n=1 Tax=Notolabrus celidotus TaxID=1203425 RepID=UPI00148FE418|nr:galectin-3-like isoform X2 [Notolabrus celidotus]
MDLVSSVLSTLSLPQFSILAPDPSTPPSSTSPPPPPQHSDALCGSCPSSGSAPQPNGLWPALPQSSPSFPSWPAPPTQPAPCWPGQPNTPCWPGTQTTPYSVPAPVLVPAPAAPTPAPTTPIAPAPAPFQYPAPVQAPGQPCQPCWPGPQYQTPQPPAPIQAPVPGQVLTPAPTPVPVPAPPPSSRWLGHPGWHNNPGQSGWPGQGPNFMPPNWLPPTSGPLSVPYNLNLARGVYDKMMMTILGHVKPNAKMFTVNFLRGNDIAFHINPRFCEAGKQVLVRNHKLGERWGPEERELKPGPFPFALGSPFEMKIMCTKDSFRVAVNNMPLFEFKHRIRELNRIDRINILHDVVLTYVNVETLP